MVNRYAPPPSGVPSPFEWGDETKVRALLGSTHRVYHALAPEQADAFRNDLIDLYRRYVTPADGKVRGGREYIVTPARRA